MFPHVPRRQRNRRKIHQRYNAIRGLRNRVFHFEPLWNRPTLRQEHDDMLESLAWISPTMAATVRLVDRFDDVYVRGSDRIEQQLRMHLGL